MHNHKFAGIESKFQRPTRTSTVQNFGKNSHQNGSFPYQLFEGNVKACLPQNVSNMIQTVILFTQIFRFLKQSRNLKKKKRKKKGAVISAKLPHYSFEVY